MSKYGKLDHHHRVTAERILRHPTSHNIQWHDVESLLEHLGECRETTHGSFEVKMDGMLHVFAGPLSRDLTDQHVSDMRKVLRHVGITQDSLKVH